MATHTAKSLFDQNMQNCDHLLNLYDGIQKFASNPNDAWLLRAVVVFSVSALDAYFHDKVKYRVGHFNFTDMPEALRRFEIPIGEIEKWGKATRKGNVLRNWVVEHYSYIPLQTRDDIRDALKLIGIDNVWTAIEPDQALRKAMLIQLREITKRRNQVAHEGDRLAHRSGGKKLRPIDKPYVERIIHNIKALVNRVERVSPN
jgi:RiboL-PSP-HEPN